MALGWNIFRYLADVSHLVSVCLLLQKMLSKKSCYGVSLKTQVLYLVVFCTRYMNKGIFSPPLYNILFKLFYVGSAAAIVVLMKTRLRASYEKRHDTFQIAFILVLCLPFAYFSMPIRNFGWFMMAYSLWVESFAIVPQLILLGRSRKLVVMTRDCIFFMSVYRLFYIMNWVYKLATDTGRTQHVLWITGILQTVIYSDFIYVYLRTKVTGAEFELPYR